MAKVRHSEFEFFLILVFQLAGADIFLYYRVGESVPLPCNSLSACSDCSTTSWYYRRDYSPSITEVVNGGKLAHSRGDRLSLGSNCSLLVRDVRAEDPGAYNCQHTGGTSGRLIYLSLLTISFIPAGPDLKPGGPGTLKCSLLGYPICGSGLRLTWMDDKGVQMKDSHHCSSCPCETSLRLQEEQKNRRLRCQLTQQGEVKTYVDFSPSSSATTASVLVLLARAGVAAGLFLTSALLVRCLPRSKGSQADGIGRSKGADPTYVNV